MALEWLAKHLGHDLNTHRNFYREQEGVIELTKVSKLLIAVDDGDLAKYRNKKLSDIVVDGTFINYFVFIICSLYIMVIHLVNIIKMVILSDNDKSWCPLYI